MSAHSSKTWLLCSFVLAPAGLLLEGIKPVRLPNSLPHFVNQTLMVMGKLRHRLTEDFPKPCPAPSRIFQGMDSDGYSRTAPAQRPPCATPKTVPAIIPQRKKRGMTPQNCPQLLLVPACRAWSVTATSTNRQPKAQAAW